MFCDKAEVKIKAGNGGDGIASFLHEIYKEFGGPDGGDGGKGGDVIFSVDDNLNTLYYFKTHHQLSAENGERGKRKKSHGKNGKDLIVKVPRGTVVMDTKTGKEIVDMSEVNKYIVAYGGEGGYGNAHFVSSVRQAPRVAELGEPGEEFLVTLELKMIADVGLIGLPNVGKSTFLSVVSAAKPKIADYEFTTLVPNLGVIEPGSFESETGFIAADIPGLIEGASKGRGLGDEFLRHIERTKILVHFLDATHEDLRSDYLVIRKELKDYVADLTDKAEIVVINKIDAISPEELKIKMSKAQTVVKSKILTISAAAHKNIPSLIHEIETKLKKTKRSTRSKIEKAKSIKEFTLKDVKGYNLFEIEKQKNYYKITGHKIEKFAVRTDFSDKYAFTRFKDIIKKTGIEKELRRQGAEKGDKIIVAGKEFKL